MSMLSSNIPAVSLFNLALPVLMGREGEDEGKDGEKPGEGGTGAGEQKPADNSAGAGGTTDESLGDPQKKITAQDEIIARKQRQLEELTPELEELRKFRKEIEDSKLSEKEKVDARNADLAGAAVVVNDADDAGLTGTLDDTALAVESNAEKLAEIGGVDRCCVVGAYNADRGLCFVNASHDLPS